MSPPPSPASLAGAVLFFLFFFFLLRMNLINVDLDFPQLLVRLDVFSKTYQPLGYILLSTDDSRAHVPVGVSAWGSAKASRWDLGTSTP